MSSIAIGVSATQFRAEPGGSGGESWRVIRNADEVMIGEARTELEAFKQIVRLLEEEALAAGYRALAQDEDSEEEAQAWMNAPLGSHAA
jgi:hypothetical protein